MKRIITAATAVFLLLSTLCMTAYAAADPDTPTGTDYTTDTTENPFTPSGTGTVVDTATDGDGKEFYTIVAPDDSVFYLVIDRQRSTENVYFLNAVTVNDLMPLAAESKTQTETVTTPAPTAPLESTPAETPPPDEQEQSGNNNTGMLIIVLVLAVLGGGAAWYFKIYRSKQQGGSADEYEPPIDEDEIDLDDWDSEDTDGTDEDAPPWDEESGADE